MDPDLILKIASQGGAPVLIVAIVAWVAVKYLVPLVREAMTTHREDIAKIMEGHSKAQADTVTAFNTTLDRFERRADKQTEAILNGIGKDVSGIRADMDKIAASVTNLSEKTGSFKRSGGEGA